MPASPWNISRGPYPFELDEIVVATQHARLVAHQLEVDVPAPNDLLGLTRFKISVTDALVPRIEARAARDPDARQWLVRHPHHSGLPLDRLLLGLRAIFAGEYAGWTPTMGKNRLVGQVNVAGEVSHGGGDDPHRYRARPPAARADGPGHGVRVGVIDTAYFPNSWSAGAVAGRYTDSYPPGAAFPFPGGHGTFVTGLILNQAPSATIEMRRGLDEEGQATSWDIAEKIVQLGRSGVDVLNLSMVSYTEDGQPPIVLSTAIDRLDPDVVVVAAAGNHGALRGQTKKPVWPAALDDVVAVGACDRHGLRAAFSPDAPWVDLHAVGVDAVSTYPPAAIDPKNGRHQRFPGGWARWSGTSFAAALISGAVAAGTEPGRTSAKQALLDITAGPERAPKPRGATSGSSRTPASFVPLRVS